MEDCVARGDWLDAGKEALAHRRKVGVRKYRALRAPGRAAGVEEPRRIGRSNGCGLVASRVSEQAGVFTGAETDDALERRQFAVAPLERRVPGRIDKSPACARMVEHVGELARMQLAVDGNRTLFHLLQKSAKDDD